MLKSRIYLFLFLFLFSLIACKKYEDGPLISFRSDKKRLMGGWEVEKVFVNGVDSTQHYFNSLSCLTFINLIKDQTSVSSTRIYLIATPKYPKSITETRASVFPNEDYTLIEVLGDSGYFPVINCVWELTRLKDKEVWYKTSQNSTEYEVRLKTYER